MFINNFDPVAIQIFSFEIRWYSLAYVGGIIFGWVLSKRFFISNQDLKENFFPLPFLPSSPFPPLYCRCKYVYHTGIHTCTKKFQNIFLL